MRKNIKNGKRRLRGLFVIAVALILVASWIQVPKVIHATENAFPEASVASEYESGSVSGDVTGGDTTESGGETGGDNTGSGGETGGDNTGSGSETGGDNTGSGGETGGDNTGSGDETGGDSTGSGGETGGDNAGTDDETGGDNAGSGGDNSGSGDTSSGEKPSTTEKPKTKANGQVSVRMDDYVYGGVAPSVWVSSLTGDAKKATITYKLTGAADSTYSSSVPTEAGNYTVRAVLPATDTHTSAAATDTFTIHYLTAPTPSFNISGIRGEGGWYTSDVRIKPPAGYEISVGDRSHFSTEAYVISETQSDLRLYLKKTDTGEMTAQLAIAHLRIDKAKPTLKGIVNDETYYGDEFIINVVEENLKSVQVNGTEVEVEQDENGNNVIVLKPGNELKEYEVSVTDKAGNKAVYQFKLASESTLEGMVREGEMILEPGVKYTFPQGSDWKMYGDETIYGGGVSFYVTEKKTVHFSKY